jgi:hypothetical protein
MVVLTLMEVLRDVQARMLDLEVRVVDLETKNDESEFQLDTIDIGGEHNAE